MNPYRAMPRLPGASPGNILYPGGATSLHPNLLGGTVSGALPYTGVIPGSRQGRNRTIVVPYAVPVWSGGYYGYGYAGYPGYGMPVQQQPNITVVMPEQQTPSIVINHHYNSPDAERPTVTAENVERGQLRVYEATPRQAQPPDTARSYVRDDKPNIYMIVTKDDTVRRAIGYWTEGDLLKYVTPQATIGSVPLSQVDRGATARLNAQNNLELDLPPEIQ